MIVLGLTVGIGMLVTAQRIAVEMEGYVVGQRMRQVHEQEVALNWLDQQVTGSSSPVSLARQEESRRLNLVAWSSLQDLPSKPVPAASSQPEQIAAMDDTSD